MNKKILSNKIEWAYWWWVIGDALWLPVETWTKEKIMDNLWWISWYLPISNNGFLAKDFANGADLPFDQNDLWVISDDSIFTMAGMNSISEKSKIDLQNLFDRHKVLFDKYGPYRFGGITREKFKEYKWDINSLWNVSWWNGVMMKRFPYAAYMFAMWDKIDDKYIYDTVVNITKTTHNTLIWKLTSLMHNKFLMILLASDLEGFDMWLALDKLHKYAKECEEKLGTNMDYNDSKDSNIYISPIIQKLIKQYDDLKKWDIYSYDKILEEYLIKLDDSQKPNINKTRKPGFHVASTFGIVYACFIQNQNFQWLIDTIQIGYDTDSQAAIIWNMIWALRWPFYPDVYKEWINQKYQKDITDSLCEFQKTIASI